MRIDNDMLGYFATHQQELDEIVEELALVGFPDCNTDEEQDRVARKLGFQNLDDMYGHLTDDEALYITRELRKRVL